MEKNLTHSKLCDSIDIWKNLPNPKLLSNLRASLQLKGATYYHSLRVHLQVIQWKTLMTTNADPLEWGWKVRQKFFAPIMTDLEPAPKELLNFVRCNCKTTSRNTCGRNLCSCRKNGLTGVAACGDCRGESCNNSSSETEDDNEDRSLFEQFENFYI